MVMIWAERHIKMPPPLYHPDTQSITISMKFSVYLEHDPPQHEEVTMESGGKNIKHKSLDRGKGKGKGKKQVVVGVGAVGDDFQFMGEANVNVNKTSISGIPDDINAGVGAVGDEGELEGDGSDSDSSENFDMEIDTDDDELYEKYVDEHSAEIGNDDESNSGYELDDVVITENDMDGHRISDAEGNEPNYVVFNLVEIDQAYRAKKQALKKLEGSPEHQFSKLWDYAEELRKTNPSSTVILGVNDENGENSGAEGIQRYMGVVLDSPETGFEHSKGEEFTFMSNKQKGLIQTFISVFPNSAHRLCVRHLHNNFKTSGFKGLAYKNALWKAARASTPGEFKLRMEELRQLDQTTFDWFNDKPASEWSKSHFTEIPKCDMLNNCCESFNANIIDARDKPIITMLEWIREYLMRRLQENRDKAARKWTGGLCPKIQFFLQKHVEKIGDCIPIKTNDRHSQISCYDGGQFLWTWRGEPAPVGIGSFQRFHVNESVSETETNVQAPILPPIIPKEEANQTEAITQDMSQIVLTEPGSTMTQLSQQGTSISAIPVSKTVIKEHGQKFVDLSKWPTSTD
ncbi:UNVERIFIED_CONTAM: hypothetical protein Slati_1751100 [Sesamum latifolium]|uniref:Transposase n=1 Tax=Sesamum latifolium TaxID=2727402 RepID=A0AAW2WWH3_9LAMI